MNISLSRQLILIGGGMLVAVGAGYALPNLLAQLGFAGSLAMVLALAALVGLALLARGERADVQALSQEIDTLRAALRLVERVLSGGHAEAVAARDAESNGRDSDNDRVERVVAEVRVLQGLIERLAEPSPALPQPAEPAPSEAPQPGVGEPAASPARASDPVAETLREALRLDRVDIFLQPVVALPQRKPRFYECFSRVRAADGSIVLPEDYLPVAEREGLTGTIDNIQLFRCVQLVRRARRKAIDTAFFCNLSPRSLGDPDFFPAFTEFLAENADLASGMVFEFPQADADALFRERRAELARLAQLGYRFSLDRVSDLRLDPGALAAHNLRFVKIEAERLLADGRSPADNRALKEALDKAGIALVVEKLEREKDLLELLDAGLDFGQGYLFGQPRPARAA